MSGSALTISVVIASFNTRDLLRECLRSLHAGAAPAALETIVVDNASSDGSVEMVRREFPQTVLIEAGSNLGFGRATNLGTARASGDIVIWLNSDCVAAPGSLSALADHLAATPSVGACGPRLVFPDGRMQPSAQSFPTGARVLWHFLGVRHLARSAAVRAVARRLPGLGSMSRGYLEAHEPSGSAREVDWVTGACIAFPRALVDRVGPLDERYFMYCEDTDWCHRVRDAGLRVDFVPSVRVTHHVGASRAQNPVATYHYYRSLYLYLQRYRPGSMGAVRACLATGSFVRGVGRALGAAVGGRAGWNPWWAVLRLSLSGDAAASPGPGLR